MITIIAQSLRIARNISYILQADIEMDGYYANDKYFITWTYGHMVEINTPRGNTGYWFHDASFPVLPKEYALNGPSVGGSQKSSCQEQAGHHRNRPHHAGCSHEQLPPPIPQFRG